MSDSSGIKSQGLKFAEQQLQKHGWTEGKGLGKKENGISQAIKVKVKCDHAGVGHDSAEQFTFHWWDHVFNKTASSISVETDKDGVQVKKLTEDECTVTNKKPRKGLTNKDMLYGRFVKSATLLSGGEQPVEGPPSSESSDSEDEDEKLNLSSATKLTDDDLMKVCGGRTAHKGARHGLTMSAKLSRLEEQEREFLEKYGKKKQQSQKIKPEDEQSLMADNLGSSKKCKKKKKHREESDCCGAEDGSEVAPKSKKKSKKNYDEVERTVENGCVEAEMPGEKGRKTSKKKKKDHEEPEDNVENGYEEDRKTLKKKKSKKDRNVVVEEEESAENQGEDEQEAEKVSKKKKKRKHKECSPTAEEQMEPSVDSTDDHVKPKKKKKHRNGE
ncbi:G patch domain-containing protein 4 isoform 1-T2 [Discoglossus pictus]